MKKKESPTRRRRFLVSYLPTEIERHSKLAVYEGRLADGGNGGAHLVRYGRRRSLDIHVDGYPSRPDRIHSTRLTGRQFSKLWPATEGNRAVKLRTTVTRDGWRITVDRYADELSGLRLADIEPLGTDGDAAEGHPFEPPLWLGPEVTGDPLFTDENLFGLTTEKAQAVFGPLLAAPAPAVGAVPFLEVKGETKVVLITTKSKARWIFPKGTPEPKLSDEELALVEAQEEAGAGGKLIGKANELYYWRGYRCSRIRYFPMAVKKLKDDWDERSQRDRRVCGLSAAIELLADPSFAALTERLWREFTRSTVRYRHSWGTRAESSTRAPGSSRRDH